MIVIFDNGNEAIITSVEDETKTIKEWFDEGGRIISEYTRREVPGIVIQFYVGMHCKK